jgi:hypothetical protein
MSSLPISIIVVIAVATVFLTFTVGLTYGIQNNFIRTRLMMTGFFFYIVITLSASFWNYAPLTLPYTIPATIVGILFGYFMGVRTAEEKLEAEGLDYYMEHFAHIHMREIKSFNWWSFINFYSCMGALIMVNLFGLSTVIFRGATAWVIITSSVGALLIGTIIPYLMHLWSIHVRYPKR